MLILARDVNEEIVITTPSGDVITVMICEIRRDKVKIGVRARLEIMIDRKEVHERKLLEARE